MFIPEPVLAEMILEMLPPPPRVFGRLALSELERTGQALACPQCGDAMKPTTIHEVELDHCPKHGVWFDQDELRITLYRTGLPANPPPFREWEPAPQVPPPPPPRRVAAPPRTAAPTARRLVFDVAGREVITELEVIKIGKLASAPLRIEGEHVARMHAVIEATPAEVIVIDLGSSSGTFVNGRRVNKATIAAGDVLRFGTTDVRLVAT